MTRYDSRLRILAVCLSALAGFVHTLGFIKLGGFFISFMSGNSTRLAVGIAQGSAQAALAGGLIGAFILGVIAGSLVGHFARAHRRPFVLSFVAALLALAAVGNEIGMSGFAVFLMTLSMGAENAIFERSGEVTIGLTYMTGALVKLGQRLTSAILGGDSLAWISYLNLWLGLVFGAAAGALFSSRLGLSALWIAASSAALLAMAAAYIGPDQHYENVACAKFIGENGGRQA